MQRIQYTNGTSKTKLIITNPKSESSKRRIPIPDCVMFFLSEFKGDDETYVLTGPSKPVEPRTMQYSFNEFSKTQICRQFIFMHLDIALLLFALP